MRLWSWRLDSQLLTTRIGKIAETARVYFLTRADSSRGLLRRAHFLLRG